MTIKSLEQVLSEIGGVKHTYSMSRPGIAVLTVQFEVGEPRTEALVRLYNAIYSNQDWQPRGVGILPPLVKPKGIDDVPIVAATLWTDDPERGTHELLKVAHSLEAEIKRVKGTRDVYTIGGAQNIVHVELDPERVAALRKTLDAGGRAIALYERYGDVPHPGAFGRSSITGTSFVFCKIGHTNSGGICHDRKCMLFAYKF